MNTQERVKELVKNKRKRMQDLAEYCGMTYQTLHRKLMGELPLDTVTLALISEFTGASIGYLLGEAEIIQSNMVEVSGIEQVHITGFPAFGGTFGSRS